MQLFSRIRHLLNRISEPLSGTETTRSDGGRRTDGVVTERVTAEREDTFVVFHIGMRINTLWKVHRWLPFFLVAPRMVRELAADEESGLLGSRSVVGPGLRNLGFIQYWDSFEALRDYARDSDRQHFPVWQDYYRNGTKDDAPLGIWHETYVVDPDDCETVYINMPAHGLGASHGAELERAVGQRDTAGGRIGRTDGTDSN